MKHQYVTLREFAEEFRISRATIYRQLRAGELRAVKFGARTLIPVEIVKEWRESRPEYRPLVGRAA